MLPTPTWLVCPTLGIIGRKKEMARTCKLKYGDFLGLENSFRLETCVFCELYTHNAIPYLLSSMSSLSLLLYCKYMIMDLLPSLCESVMLIGSIYLYRSLILFFSSYIIANLRDKSLLLNCKFI